MRTSYSAFCFLLSAFLLGVYLWTAAPTITTAFGSSDSGELASAVVVGGVPHPPGYPTYLLVGRVAMLMPWGEPAARLVWLNGACMALAAVMLALSLPSHESSHLQNINAMLTTALIFGLNPRIWQQSIVVEVYALAMLLFVMLLWLTQRWWTSPAPPTSAALGLVFGLGLGVQLPIVAWLVGVIVMLVMQRRRVAWRDLAWFGAMTLIGMSVYFVLIWRGRVAPAVSWGDWTTLDGMWAHVSAREYRYLVASVPFDQMLGRIGFVVRDLVSNVGLIGMALAMWGIMRSSMIQHWRWLSVGIALPTLLWAISYGGADAQVYLLPLHGLAAWWAGWGVQNIEQRTKNRAEGRKQKAESRKLGNIGWVLLPIVLAVWGLRLLPAMSLRHDTAIRDRAVVLLESAAPNAVLITNDDSATFPLWYAQRVLGIRRDVIVRDERLKQYEWYRREVNGKR